MTVNPQKGWEMFFDGASRSPTLRIMWPKSEIVSPDNALIPYSFSLAIGCSNNTAEYEAVITRLELVLQIPVTSLTIYVDSELVVKQLCRKYNVKKTELIPYHEKGKPAIGTVPGS